MDELTDHVVVRRCELTDGRLFRTADLDCSRSGNFIMGLGVRLRFLAMRASLSAFCRLP